ncbi:hypothetical protein SDC9_37627 [bioreactor metagenome]|uniref:Uncharacterized protein n=1 Tax=bioreactor metagenome TaxID=1076179 RepID=A0A644VLM6_9ZZZZ
MPTDDTFVPLGAAYYPVPAGSPTRSYAFLLVPGFTLLAFSSAVEPLRIANQLSQQPLEPMAFDGRCCTTLSP